MGGTRQLRQKQREHREEQERKLHVVLVLVSFPVAFLCLWYTILSAEPSPTIATLLLLLAVAFALWAAWKSAKTSKGKVISVFVAAIVFVSLEVFQQRHLSQREQDDTYAHLDVRPSMPKSGNVLKTGITVTNGGGVDIAEHAVQCFLRRVVYAPYGGISQMGMQTTQPETAKLRAHGDGETSYCIAGIQAFPPDSHPVCADITVSVSYSLSTQQDRKETKQFRFVAEGEEFAFRQQPVEYPGDYCPVPKVP